MDGSDAFGQSSGRTDELKMSGITRFDFYNIKIAAGFAEFIIFERRQRAQTQRYAEIGALAQFAHEREHYFAHRYRIFAGLDVDVRDGSGTMMDNPLGKFVGLEPESVKRTIVAAHGAILTILAAVAGNLDDSADKDAASEYFIARRSRLFVQYGSHLALRMETQKGCC
jgi:hypothetical protein